MTEDKLLQLERRLARRMALAEKAGAQASRKAESDARRDEGMARQKMEEDCATNQRFEAIARAQRESEQCLLMAIRSKQK